MRWWWGKNGRRVLIVVLWGGFVRLGGCMGVFKGDNNWLKCLRCNCGRKKRSCGIFVKRGEYICLLNSRGNLLMMSCVGFKGGFNGWRI